MRRTLLIAISFLGSAFILWLVVRGVPLADVWAGMQKADPLWLLASLVSIFFGLATRAVRWRGLLDDKLAMRPAIHLTNITFMLNQLPLRLGEVARAGLSIRYGVPFMTAATSILVERLVDVLFIVLMIAIALTQVPSASAQVSSGAFVFGLVALLGFLVLVFFASRRELARRFLALAERLLPLLKRLPLARLLEQVIDGLQPLTHWRSFVHTTLWTFIAWGFSYASLITLFYALDVQDAPYLLMCMLAVGFTAIGIAIPISVMSLGPFQAVMLLVAHQIFGVDEALALTLGFLFNGVAVLSYLAWGGLSMFALGLSFGDVLGSKATPPTPDAQAEALPQPKI